MLLNKIKLMRIVALVILLSLAGLFKDVLGCGDSSCSNNCQLCSSVNWCNNCCINFGV